MTLIEGEIIGMNRAIVIANSIIKGEKVPYVEPWHKWVSIRIGHDNKYSVHVTKEKSEKHVVVEKRIRGR
jgi:uncharacterized protein YgiM (DUF1202 family)